MNRPFKAVLLGAVLTSLAAVTAFAQESANDGPDTRRPRATIEREAAAPPAREVAADAPNARIAALIRRDLLIPRNKGVQSVRRIARGVYCVLPTAASGVNRQTAIVQLTPEYWFSLQTE